MFRSVVFILLAVALASVSFGLTQISPNPLFNYGVAFIGYSVGAALVVMGVITRNAN